MAIHAQYVEQLENANYRYGLGSYAQFFYDSHIVGFVGQTKLNISGLEFAPTVKPAILIHQGTMAFDEVMISNVDWSVPVGHGGSGHGGMSVGHAFEDGRQPVEIENWFLY